MEVLASAAGEEVSRVVMGKLAVPRVLGRWLQRGGGDSGGGDLLIGGSEGKGELAAARGDDGGMPTWLMELAWPGIFQAWALLTIV